MTRDLVASFILNLSWCIIRAVSLIRPFSEHNASRVNAPESNWCDCTRGPRTMGLIANLIRRNSLITFRIRLISVALARSTTPNFLSSNETLLLVNSTLQITQLLTVDTCFGLDWSRIARNKTIRRRPLAK
mgnify:CR=1 FL=1